MQKLKYLILTIIILIHYGCSSSKPEQQNELPTNNSQVEQQEEVTYKDNFPEDAEDYKADPLDEKSAIASEETNISNHSPKFRVQVGAYSSPENAQKFITEALPLVKDSFMILEENGLYLIQVNKDFDNKTSADTYKSKLQKKNSLFKDAFVIEGK